MKLSIVIPAYNEANSIERTIRDIREAVSRSGVKECEFIVVDDHSEDSTFELVKGMGEKNINSIRLSRRGGSHTAIRAGLRHSRGDATLCISADGQEDPGVLAEMAGKWKAGAKIVWALRRDRRSENWHIRKFAQLFYYALSFLGESQERGIDFSRADFFLLDSRVVKSINACSEKNTSLFGLIGWLGFGSDFVEYDRRPRAAGKTKWSFRRRVRLAKDWIIAFSGLPLKIMSAIGMFIAVFGFIYGLYLVINYMVGSPSPGWSSIMVAIFILGGVQMMMLGIIGEYLWRNLDESRKRPLYFIEASTTNAETD
ncbi:MAG: glycosyltransferase family 2 protein [Candidatus Omnitrophica bacterium]|nr:glycosyltransferase family 2 protein [Candidatus Omnitrophota bacterium]